VEVDGHRRSGSKRGVYTDPVSFSSNSSNNNNNNTIRLLSSNNIRYRIYITYNTPPHFTLHMIRHTTNR
jgi:hypothetical protein